MKKTKITIKGKKNKRPNVKSISPIRVTNSNKNNNQMTSRRPFIVKHTELITSIKSDTLQDFLAVSCNLSPSSPDTYPWLSQLSNSFEYYTFKSLTIRYVPRCSMMISGSITIAYDYDITDPDPVHTADLAAMLGSKTVAVYEPVSMAADPRSLHLYPYRYLHTSGSDPRMESPGKLLMMINGDDSSVLGDLFIDYEVELFAPQFPEEPGTYYSVSGLETTNVGSPLPGVPMDVYTSDVSVLNSASRVKIKPNLPGKWVLSITTPAGSQASLVGAPLQLNDPGQIINKIVKIADTYLGSATLGSRVLSYILDISPKFGLNAIMNSSLATDAIDVFFSTAINYISTAGRPGWLSFSKIGDTVKTPSWSSLVEAQVLTNTSSNLFSHSPSSSGQCFLLTCDSVTSAVDSSCLDGLLNEKADECTNTRKVCLTCGTSLCQF